VGKIGFRSRYYEPFTALLACLNLEGYFKLVYNEDKRTYSIPYLYEGYKNELDTIKVSENIIKQIKSYLEDNLFTSNERQLLLTELAPYIEKLGSSTVKSLNNKIDIATRFGDAAKDKNTILEYQSTIKSVEQINQIVKQEFLKGAFMKSDQEPEVFISYSHDNELHKDWVLQLATRLRSNGVNVILDRWTLKLGSDLASFMERGLSASHRVICICSDGYVRKANEGKGGAGYEKQIITAELITDQNTSWVIPLIKGNTSLKKTPTFLSGRLYTDFDELNLYEKNYETLLRDLLDEPVLPIPPLGKNPFQTIKAFAEQKFIPAHEKYVSPAIKGTITFDYSNNNGKYSIGQAELLFETAWSKASEQSIYLYSDPPSINGIGIAKGITSISEIEDAREYDTSSRTRLLRLNQIAVLQNENGFYAAIKILGVKDDTRGDAFDEVTFEYFIQTNGSPDFTNS
jgi:hypothetical protein